MKNTDLYLPFNYQKRVKELDEEKFNNVLETNAAILFKQKNDLKLLKSNFLNT